MAMIRHGQCAWNAERRFVGKTDVPLDEVGRAQARFLADHLPRGFDAVYSSPLKRAMQTADALTPPASRVVGTLAELDQGELEGLAPDVAFERFPAFFAAWKRDPSSMPCPGGESLQACQDRALASLEHIRQQHSGGQLVAVVSHQIVMSAITLSVVGERLGSWKQHFVGNTALTVLSWSDGKWRLEAENWQITE